MSFGVTHTHADGQTNNFDDFQIFSHFNDTDNDNDTAYFISQSNEIKAFWLWVIFFC